MYSGRPPWAITIVRSGKSIATSSSSSGLPYLERPPGQALGVGRGILGGKRVRRVGEAHHVGRGVVDETRAPHAGAVHDLEQRLGILHDLDHAVAIHVRATPHDRERRGLELAPRLNMD